jgi:hypothetical protein
MHTSSRRLAIAIAIVLAGLGASAAQAKEEFPGEIARSLGLGYDPPCRLCHVQGTTGAGSVVTPFGISMQAHGLTGSRSSIAPALEGLRADKTDSDGDGKPDVDELIANTDPNTPADVMLANSSPQYGCSVGGHGRARRSVEALCACLVGLAAVLLRKKRPAR